MFIDPSLLFLFLFAITCIVYGSIKSRALAVEITSSETHKDTAEAMNSLKIKNVILFPIVGCIVLLLLFFFFHLIYYALLVIVIIVSFVSLFFVLSPAVDYLFDSMKWTTKVIPLPRNKEVHASAVFLSSVCVLIILLWILTGFWLIVDCIAWCIGVTQLAVIKLPNLKLSVILLCLFLLYDVFWVFISPFIFHGKSVMVTVATEMPTGALPLALTMPHIIGDGYSLLGLGDIVLPGLFVCFVYNFDHFLLHLSETDNTVKPPKTRYFAVVLLGYTLGYACTLLGFVLMQKGQPALLYLVPFTLIPIIIHAYRHQHLEIMWTGIQNVDKGDEEQALVDMNSSAQELGANNNTDEAEAADAITDAMKRAMMSGGDVGGGDDAQQRNQLQREIADV